MEINYCFPKKRRCNFDEGIKYEIINNIIYHNNGVSKIYSIRGKQKKCNKCNYFSICCMIERKDPINFEIEIFCTIKQCKKGFYKGE